MKHILTAAAASLILGAGAAHAITFSGDLDGDWVGSTGFNNANGSLDDSGDYASWGNTGDTPSQMNILDGGFSHELMGGHNLYKLGEVEWTNESWTNFDPVFTLFADWTIDIDSPVNASSGFTDWFDFEIDTSNNGSSAPEELHSHLL